jgi:hypothetical protein
MCVSLNEAWSSSSGLSFLLAVQYLPLGIRVRISPSPCSLKSPYPLVPVLSPIPALHNMVAPVDPYLLHNFITSLCILELLALLPGCVGSAEESHVVPDAALCHVLACHDPEVQNMVILHRWSGPN